MSKIGILTIVNVDNYGAELQAFALHRKLKDLGHDNEIINYLYYIHPEYKTTSRSKPIFKISTINKLKWKAIKTVNFFKRLLWSKEAKNRGNRFNSFHQKNTKFSKTFKSYDELYNANLNYDIYIIGSDQVWNPTSQTSILPYFLTFAPKTSKKLSYAPSFGVSDIPLDQQDVYKECLNNIDVLSSRERRGTEMIKEITGREATHVVDPTLLLSKEEWSSIASLPKLKSDQPYILIYVITYSPYIKKLAEYLSDKTGYRLIRICKNAGKEDANVNIENISDAGPAEFLGYFSKASFVVSNSFHGTIFSTIFNKPFYTIIPGHKSNTVRQRDLLNLMGLESRLIAEGGEFPNPNSFDVDFTEANKIISAKINDSISYLKNAVEK